MTVWPARRLQGRLLCGRLVAGQYPCQGVIAWVAEDMVRNHAMMPPGMVEDPPGSHFWRQTSRAVRRAAEGVGPSRRHLPRGMGIDVLNEPALPWRRRCPHCRVLAEVTADLLS